MSWSLTDYIPPWGDGGERPSDNTQYDGGDTLNEKHFDYLWSSLRTLQEEVQSALSDVDSDADGVVDEADSANAIKGNDIDSDGDGVVNAADDTTTVKGNDIDSDGDGTVDSADSAVNATSTYKGNDIDNDGDGVVGDSDQYDGTAPSDGSNGQLLQTDGSTTSWVRAPYKWSGDGTVLSPDAPEIGIDVGRIRNKDYKEDHVVDTVSTSSYTANLSKSNTQKLKLSSDTTISFSGVNASMGNSCTLRLVQGNYPDKNIETFEDGDADGWVHESGSLSAVQSTQDGADPFKGDWCGEVTDGGTHHTLPFSSISPDSFGVAIRSEVGSSYSNNKLIVSFRSGGNNVMTVTHPRTEREPNISVNGQDTGVSGNYSTWFNVHFLNIDWSSNVIGSVEIDGNEVLTNVSFQNPADDADSVRFEPAESEHTDGHTGYIDNIVVPSVPDSTDHTPTFNNVQWPDGQTPSWSTAANAIDVVSFVYDPDDDVWRGMPSGYNMQ